METRDERALRALQESGERRTMDVAAPTVELVEERAADGEKQYALRGLAAVFEADSQPIYGEFIERIARGAFRRVLDANPDVPLLLNHDTSGIPLARTANGTLTLEETPRGLAFTATLRATALSEEIHAAVERGDLAAMSFAFSVARDEWTHIDGAMSERRILEFRDLYEISVVTNPAYLQTQVEAARADGAGSERSVEAKRQERDTQADTASPTALAEARRAHRAREVEILRLKESANEQDRKARRGASRRT